LYTPELQKMIRTLNADATDLLMLKKTISFASFIDHFPEYNELFCNNNFSTNVSDNFKARNREK
jgi:hypothetical protein